MVYKGSTNLKPLYKGNVPIVNGYVGTKQVYATAINVTFYASLYNNIEETVELDALYDTLKYPYNFDYVPDKGYVFDRWDTTAAWHAGGVVHAYAYDYDKLYAVFKKTVTYNIHELARPDRIGARFPVESDWEVNTYDAIVELRPHQHYLGGSPHYSYDYGVYRWSVQISKMMSYTGGGYSGYVATSVHLSPDTLATDISSNPEPHHYYIEDGTGLTLADVDTTVSSEAKRVLRTPLYRKSYNSYAEAFVTDKELLPSANVVDLYLCYAKWVRFSCRYTTPDDVTYSGREYTCVWFSMHSSKTTIELPDFSDVDAKFAPCVRWRYTKVVGDSTETAYGVPGEVIPLETIKFYDYDNYFDIDLIGE